MARLVEGVRNPLTMLKKYSFLILSAIHTDNNLVAFQNSGLEKFHSLGGVAYSLKKSVVKQPKNKEEQKRQGIKLNSIASQFFIPSLCN